MNTVPLRHVAAIVAGQSPPSEAVAELTDGIPFLQGNAEFGQENPTARWQCDEAPKQCQRGDLLISVRAPVGALNWADRQYGIGRGLAAIRPTSGMLPKFLMYAIRANLPTLNAAATGSTFAAVTSDDLKSLSVPAPSIHHQLRIADFLDEQVARLDTLQRLTAEQGLSMLERYRASLSLLALQYDGLDRRVTPLRHLFEFERNGIWGDEPNGGADDVPCVRVADFDRGRFVARSAPTVRRVPLSQRAPRLLLRGDVLLEKSGGTPDKPVGCAVSYDSDEPAVCSNFVAVLRPKRGVHARFAGLVMAALYQTRQNGPFVTQTTGIQNLDSNRYLGLKVGLPPREVQAVVAEELDARGLTTQNALALQSRRSELIEERKQALISAAVTGQLDVTTAGRES